MDKIKHSLGNLSLRKSIVLYITIFVVIALTLSICTAYFCNLSLDNIHAAYPKSGEEYFLTNKDGERLGNGSGTYISSQHSIMSDADERSVKILELVPLIATPVFSALCVLAAALLFYRDKLKKPLAELTRASEKISKSDLDFSLNYESSDELGQLCASFESMRSTLAENFSEMWRQVEDRKQLNAAFAHDLRTPLTVLKGYDEVLQESEDIQTRSTALTMEKHISRLEHYVDSMSSLQRLEDTKPEYHEVSTGELMASLSESAKVLCDKSGKTLRVEYTTSSAYLYLDSDFVTQVYSNLISNALRYAKTSVTLSFAEQNDGLLLSVSDDGTGFSKNSLHNAVNPYFTEAGNHSEHFGLGLYICRILCEHHSGYLKLENLANGATASAFFKSADK